MEARNVIASISQRVLMTPHEVSPGMLDQGGNGLLESGRSGGSGGFITSTVSTADTSIETSHI
jgi:hypothetical protein